MKNETNKMLISLMIFLICGLLSIAQDHSLTLNATNNSASLSSVLEFENSDKFTISTWEKTNQSTEVQRVISEIDYLINEHEFLERIEKTKILEKQDWVRVYNMPTANVLRMPRASDVMRDIYKKYKNNIVMISIAREVQLVNKSLLVNLKNDINKNKVNVADAIDLIKNTNKENHMVFALGFKRPIMLLKKEIEIIAPEEYQFLENGYQIKSKFLNNGIIDFITTLGHNCIDIEFSAKDKRSEYYSGILYNKIVAEKYKKRALHEMNYSRSSTCNGGEIRNFQVPLNGEFRCEGGCPNDPSVMEGETMVILGNDGVLDNIVMITDGIDYSASGQSRDVYDLLESLNGIESFHYLLDYGIDVMIVDWPSELGWIQNNSTYLQGIIRELNEEPTFIAIEILVGVSMGGIISRHALLQMEENNEEHNVKNWVAGDSPLEGSNIPIGVQAFARENLFNSPDDPVLIQFNDILDHPAPRQLLRHYVRAPIFDFSTFPFEVDPGSYTSIHLFSPLITNAHLFGDASILPSSDPDHESLWDYFDSRGYPKNTNKNMTIADGSSDGIPVNTPGNTLLYVDVGDDAYLKAYASDGISGRVIYKKKYDLLLTPRRTTIDHGVDNIDCSPGSRFPTQQFSAGDIIWHPLSFCHAPSTSAVGIPGNPNNTDLSSSPFSPDNIYITPENDFHSAFFDHHGELKINWLIEHLDQKRLFNLCSYDPCESYTIEHSTTGRRIFFGYPDNYRLAGFNVNHFDDPLVFQMPLSSGEMVFNYLTIQDWPEWLIDYSWEIVQPLEEKFLEISLYIDEQIIEDIVVDLPININGYKYFSRLVKFNYKGSNYFTCKSGLYPSWHDYEIEFTAKISYKIEDLAPFNPPDLIRIDGEAKQKMLKKENINIYPNPAKDVVAFEFINAVDAEQHIDVIDLNGNIIHSHILSQKKNLIDISFLSPGVYFVVERGSTNVANKLIKIR